MTQKYKVWVWYYRVRVIIYDYYYYYFKSGPKGPKVQNPNCITLFTHHFSSFLFASPSSPSSWSSRLHATHLLNSGDSDSPRAPGPQALKAAKAEFQLSKPSSTTHAAHVLNGRKASWRLESSTSSRAPGSHSCKSRILALQAELHLATLQNGVVPIGYFGVQAQSKLLKSSNLFIGSGGLGSPALLGCYTSSTSWPVGYALGSGHALPGSSGSCRMTRFTTRSCSGYSV